jgi:hypothetical protein
VTTETFAACLAGRIAATSPATAPHPARPQDETPDPFVIKG